MITRLSFVVAVFVSVVGCSGSGTETTSTPGDDSITDPSAEPQLGRPVVGSETRLANAEDAQLAFRSESGQLRASYPTHAVAVDRGVVRIVPSSRTETGVQVGAPIAIETLAIARGDVAATGFGGQSIEAATGHALIDRGIAVEEIENFEGGVEQSWRFSQPPAGSGDLEVHLAVGGHEYVSTTSTGLHFATAGKLGFRYGHATWIDADGAITPIQAAWNGGEIVLTVPNDVIAEAVYPVVLDPTITAELATDAPVIGWTGAGAQRSTIASSGSGFLVAWSDGRNGSGSDTFGTRLSAAGAVQDNLGIAIDEGTNIEDNPAAAFASTQYVVVWDDGTNVDAARVSTAGAVTAMPTIAGGTLPKIAARGAEALAVLTTSGGDVRAARFNGTTFGASFAVATGVTATTAAVAANPGGDYLVVWSQGATNPDLRGQLVTAAGTLSGAAFDVVVATGGQKDPDASWNGTDFVVVYNNSNLGDDIYGTRVSTAGVSSDPTGKVISAATGIQNQPAVACAGGTCLASWSDRRAFATNANDIFAIRLDGTLTAVGAEIGLAVLGDEQRNPSVAASGSDWRVSWHDKRHGGFDTVFTARVLADGSTPDGNGANIVSGNNAELRPVIKASANNWLSVWSDSRVLGSNIMGVRFASSGAKLDVTARTLTSAAGQQGNPALTFDGTNYLGAWNDTRNGPSQDLFAGRMDVSGNALDGAGFQVAVASGDQRRPSLATTTTGVTLAVWQDGRSGNEIYGALISGGAVTMADIPICTGAGAQLDPTVAYDSVNNEFLVAWNDDRTGDDDLYAGRVSAAGALLDGNCGVSLLGAQAGGQTQVQAAYATGVGGFYVTWTDTRSDALGDIFGSRVGSGVAPAALDGGGGGVTVAGGAAAQNESDVAFISPNLYVAIWTDGRNSGTSGTDIFGESILTSGQLDGANFVISANPEDETGATITAGPGGKPAMVAYERRRPDLDTVRVGTRRMTFTGSTGSTCSMDSSCVSGFCVDGRCCDQACGGTDKTDCQACSVGAGGQTNGLCTTILSTSHVCRGYADTFCDVREFCTGTSIVCPDDLGRRETIQCNLAVGGIGHCPANDITGAPHVCQ